VVSICGQWFCVFPVCDVTMLSIKARVLDRSRCAFQPERVAMLSMLNHVTRFRPITSLLSRDSLHYKPCGVWQCDMVVFSGRELGSGTEVGQYRPYVGAGIVWSVLQSVYASGNSSSVTQSKLSNMITDICHCLLSSVRQHSSKLSKDVYGIYSEHSFICLLTLRFCQSLCNGIMPRRKEQNVW
jgi:hypothetical protein